MDKLIPVLNFLKNNRFWLTCGILAAAMIGTWFFSTMQLADLQSKAEGVVKGKIGKADSIIKTTPEDVQEAGITAHPNETTLAGMTVELDEATKAVVEAWKIRRSRQETLMAWPKEVTRNPNFASTFTKYDPPETFPVETNAFDLIELLRIYKEGIPPRLESLCEIIGTEWKYKRKTEEELEDQPDAEDDESGEGRGGPGGIGAPGGGRGRGGGRGGAGRSVQTNKADDDISTVVLWNEENQDLWQKKLTTFRGFDDTPANFPIDAPSPLQVLMLQQDLWLLEAMFNIIKDVNGGVNARDLAVIKEIDHIAFGREARTQLGEIAKANKGLSGEKAGGAARKQSPGGGRRQARRGGKKATIDPFEKAGPDKHKSPFHGRYVDKNYAPITADDVRKVLDPAAKDLPDKNLELLVARRVPVRVAFRMDERKITEFISAAAKNEFAFEVYQVRVNKHVPGEGIVMVGSLKGGEGAGAGRGEEEEDRGSSIGAAGGAGGAGMIGDDDPNAGNKDNGDLPIELRTNYDVDVEFYGVVKIYNPVNEALLTGKAPAETASADASNDDATP